MTTQAPTESKNNAPPPPAPADAKAVAAVARAAIPTDNEDVSKALNAFASAANFNTAQRIARALAESTLVPEHYRIWDEKKGRERPEAISNCMLAIEVASRIGCSVFMAMQHLFLVHGKPGWDSTFLIATVNASGKFTPLRFRWEGTKGTDSWGCRCIAKDRETGEICEGALVDWAMVKAEGWNSRNGSKWPTMPEQMFMYRSASFWVRVYAPELSLGMQTVDEMQDVGRAEPLDFTPMRPPSALADRLRTVDAPGAEPAIDRLRQRIVDAPAVESAKVEPDPKPEPKSEPRPQSQKLDEKLRAMPQPEPPEEPKRNHEQEAEDLKAQLSVAVNEKDQNAIRRLRAQFDRLQRDWPPELASQTNRYFLMVLGQPVPNGNKQQQQQPPREREPGED